MRKGIKILFGMCLMSLCLPFSAFASTLENWEQVAQREYENEESVLLPKGAKMTTELPNSIRGRYIASSGLMIINEGYGVLGIHADTLAYEPVQKIKMTIYIDQWDEVNQDWSQIDSKALTYEYQEGDDDLHAVSEYYLVENLETGKYYRLRGLHAVWSFDGYIETHATTTDGILVTDGPA